MTVDATIDKDVFNNNHNNNILIGSVPWQSNINGTGSTCWNLSYSLNQDAYDKYGNFLGTIWSQTQYSDSHNWGTSEVWLHVNPNAITTATDIHVVTDGLSINNDHQWSDQYQYMSQNNPYAIKIFDKNKVKLNVWTYDPSQDDVPYYDNENEIGNSGFADKTVYYRHLALNKKMYTTLDAPYQEQHYHEAIKVQALSNEGKTLDLSPSNLWPFFLTHSKITDGKRTLDGFRHDISIPLSRKRLDNNLTSQQVYNAATDNSIVWSVQKDGSLIVAYNFDTSSMTYSDATIMDDVDSSYYLNYQHPEEKAKWMKATLDAYHKRGNHASHMELSCYNLTTTDNNSWTTLIETMVTPNKPTETGYTSDNLNNQSAKTQYYRSIPVTYIDDDSGKTVSNDTVLGITNQELTVNPALDVSVPQNYILADNQMIDYGIVHEKGNAPITIYLHEKTIGHQENANNTRDWVLDQVKNNPNVTIIHDQDQPTTADANNQSDINSKVDQINKDYNLQFQNIVKQVNDWKEKTADYNSQRQAYLNKLHAEGLYTNNSIDPTTISQNLRLNDNNSTQLTYQILDPNAVVSINHNIVKLTHRDHPNDFLKVTYTNLTDCSYRGRKIAKIELIASDWKEGTNSLNSSWGGTVDSIQFGRFSNGFNYNNATSFITKLKFYDEQNRQITFGNDAWFSISSLNSNFHDGYLHREGVQLLSLGEAYKIPGSVVNVHPNKWLYADSDQDQDARANTPWDSEHNPDYNKYKYLGSGLFNLNGSSTVIFKNAAYVFSKGENFDENQNPGVDPNDRYNRKDYNKSWTRYATDIPQMAFDAQAPKLELHYHNDPLSLQTNINYKIISKMPLAKYGSDKTALDATFDYKTPALYNAITHQKLSKDNYTPSGYEGDSTSAKLTNGQNTQITHHDKIYQIPGYTMHLPVDPDLTSVSNNGYLYTTVKGNYLNFNSMPKSKVLYITYTPDEQNIKINYVDDDNNGSLVQSNTIKGLTDQKIATNIFPPHNYYLTPNQNVPFTYLINANNPDIIIHLKHQIVGNDTQTDHISYATVKTSRKSLLIKLNQLYGPLVKIGMVDPTTKVVNVDDVNNATKALLEARDFYNNQMDQIQQAFIDASHGKSVTLTLRDLNLDFQVKREFKVTADIPMHDGTTQNQTLFAAHPTMHHELQMDAVTNHLGLGTWIVDQAYEKDGKKIPSYTLLEVHIDHVDYSIYNINIPKIDGYVNTLITNPKLNNSQLFNLVIIPDYTNVNRIRSLYPIRAIWCNYDSKWDSDSRNDYSYYGNKAITPSIYLNLKYIPLDQSNSIQYVDFDNNNVVAQTPITGKTDQTINLTYQLPEGYTYYDDPESFDKQYTFMAGENSPIQVYVVKNKNASIKNTSATQTNNINFLNTNHTNISQTVTGKIVSYNNFENKSEDTWSVSNHTGFKDNLRPVNEFHIVTLGDIINTLNQNPNDFIKKYSIKVNGHDIGDLTNVNQVIIQATPVNQYTQNQTNTIDIVPKSITTPVYWQYDHDGTTDIIDATKISGPIGENVAVNLQVPANYKPVNTLPTQLAVRENPYYIPIKANVVFIPSTDPKKSTDIVPGTDVKYPDTVAYNNLNKTTTRTINIYYSENNTMTVYQTVKMDRDAYFNLVTKEVTYTPWHFSNDHNWSSYKVPVNANQIADIPVVPEAIVTPETNDTVVNVTVSDFNLYNSLIFDDVDNSNTELARYNVNKGLPIKWQDFLTNTLPNYEIVPGQTFNNQSLDSTPIISVDPNNTQNLVVYVKHKTRDVTSTDPNAHHTFTRDLIINSPNGLAHKSQTITFARSATLDLATGEVIYGEWDKTSANLPEFTIPTYAGYTANGDTDKLDKLEDITPNTPDMHLSITYSPDSYIKRFCFVDSATGEVIDGYQSFANFANNSSSANLTPPPKYYFDSVQNITDPNAKLVLTNDTNATLYYTFAPDTDDTSIIQIRVKRDRSNINNKPDDTINYTRTIHITYPDGRRETMTQNAIKGDKWNAVNLAHFDNYQPDKTVNSEIATEDKTIEINYKPDSVTRTVTIRDADDNNKIIATKTITGLYDSSVSISNDIPKNYDLASDSSLIKLTNDTTIYVNHRKSYSTSPRQLVARTINYIDKATGTKVRDSDVQTKYVTFTTVTDLVTGKSTRTTDDYFDVQTVPTVKDFQQEGSLVPYQLADSNKTLTVYYDRTSGSSNWNNGTVTTSDIPIFIDPQVTTYLPDFSNLQLPSKADVGLA